MLAISSHGDERQGEFKSFPDEFSDGFSGGNLLEDIDFDDLFVGFDDGDILPDLEIDPSELFAEFSVGDEEEQATTTTAEGLATMVRENDNSSTHGEEAMSVSMEREDSAGAPMSGSSSSSSETDRGRRKTSPGQGKGSSQGKRKVKVDWTPELHRRFVQAVEQLGVDKAVPSRILEIMGIDCLTRHNIASHLQKYRSHRKHLLAREAEAASLTQRRQMYACGAGPPAAKRNVGHTWMAPTMGFPPAPPPVPAGFRPLHVWGHPSMDQSLVHVWPKHLVRAGVGAAPLPWSPPAIPHPTTPPDASYWHYYPRVPCTLTQGTPFFPQPPAMQRFSSPPVQVVLPPHPMYRPPPASKHFASQLPIDAHPATESIDAAIGDVLSKPWLPLPLGLKPPSLDSVMVELQRQGVSKIPPTCS